MCWSGREPGARSQINRVAPVGIPPAPPAFSILAAKLTPLRRVYAVQAYPLTSDLNCVAIDKRHLHRYLAEFDFRYNQRIALDVDDVERAESALRGTVGKLLTYRHSYAAAVGRKSKSLSLKRFSRLLEHCRVVQSTWNG